MNRISNQKDLMGKILYIISFIILGLMIYLLFTKPFLAIDEWFTVGLVNLDFNNAITSTILDVHPPLYYIIVMAVMNLFELAHISVDQTILIKSVSVIPYFLILILSLTKIRKDYGWFSSGVFTFTILTMGQFFIYYLTARMYSWGLLFILISFLITRNIYEDPKLKDWVLLSLFSALGAYCHYFVALATIPIYLILFTYIIIKNRSQIRNFIISCALNVVFFIPWIFTLFYQLDKVHRSYWIKPLTLRNILDGTASIVPDFGKYIAVLVVIFLIAVTIILLKRYLDSKEAEDYFLLSGALVFIGTVIITIIVSVMFKPVHSNRYLLPAAGVFWMSFSLALSKIDKDKILILITIALIIIGGVGVIKEANNISKSYDQTVDNMDRLSDMNSNDTIVIFYGLQKYMRFYGELNNTQHYYVLSINNETFEQVHVNALNLSDKSFNIPSDVFKNKGKDIYLISDQEESFDYPDNVKVKDAFHINNCYFHKISPKNS